MNPWTLRLTFAQFKNMTLPLRFFHPASTPCFFRLLTIIYGETGFLWLADLPAVWILPIAFSVCSSVFILSANWLLDPEAGSDSSLIPFIRCYLVFAQTARGTLFLILSLCHVNSLRFLMLSPPNSSRGVEGDILTLSSLLTIICQPAFQEFKGKVIFFTHMLTISELAFPMLSFVLFFFPFYGRNIYFLFQDRSTGEFCIRSYGSVFLWPSYSGAFCCLWNSRLTLNDGVPWASCLSVSGRYQLLFSPLSASGSLPLAMRFSSLARVCLVVPFFVFILVDFP